MQTEKQNRRKHEENIFSWISRKSWQKQSSKCQIMGDDFSNCKPSRRNDQTETKI